MYCHRPHCFKTRLIEKGFHTFITNVSFLSSTNVESHNLFPWRLVSSLAHRLVSSSDTICNRSSLSLEDIVHLSLLHIAISLTVLKRVDSERFPRPYKECFIFLSNRCGISQSTPFRDPTSSLIYRSVSGSDTICNNPSLPLADIVHFNPLHIAVNFTVLKRIRRGFHTFMNVSFLSPTNVESYNLTSNLGLA